jgi:hypothetical protein
MLQDTIQVNDSKCATDIALQLPMEFYGNSLHSFELTN